MTQITRKSVPMRGLILLLAMFLGAGLVLTGCGDDDTTTTPAPAPAPPPPPAPEPEPEPPAPEAPAVPTGLMVSETTETSITWTWNAVEGATGYQVQVSMDEMFTDEDATALTVEPTFTAVDLMPETSVYLRVRAGIVTDPTDLTTAILGEWTTHVTGMSAMPPPPPPAPEAPAVPTGLMVSETTETSITWTWNAVEGATGYQVQVSMDEMFTDEDATALTVEPTFTAVDLMPETSVYLRVRAGIVTDPTDLTTAILGEWTTHVTGMSAMPPPPPPAPEAPAVPTGLMVSETTETSITWTWNAVEGATGYQVQVSMDEMFTDEDATALTVEPTFTAVDLMPETSVYLRVRAGIVTDPTDLTTAILGDWTTHVTGMSAMPPPEPEPEPDPVSVSFSLSDDADSPYFLVADDDDGEETAMASVNSEIMVSSNTAAIIEPMNFAEGAASVSVSSGDNMPFQFVSWVALQSVVIDSGATFKVSRVTVGANQEMEPTGDVAYVTCGPFACQDGMDAPEISISDSPTCAAWAPTLELQVGVIDVAGNQGTDDATNEEDDPGIDMGWLYTANTDFSAAHDFGSTSVEHDVGKASNPTGLMFADGGDADSDQDDITKGGITILDVDANAQGFGCYGASDDGDGSASDLVELYGTGAGDVDKPDNCFQLDQSADFAFLSEYTVTMTP